MVNTDQALKEAIKKALLSRLAKRARLVSN